MLTIGQTIGACKVFWVDPTGSYGLAAAAADISGTQTIFAKAGSDNMIYGAKRDGYGGGMGNTNQMILKCLLVNADNNAASKCIEVVDGNFGDFYLGSKWEMEQMYANKTAAGITLTAAEYWTSTEVDETHVYSIDMTDGTSDSDLKTEAKLVRAIRKV